MGLILLVTKDKDRTGPNKFMEKNLMDHACIAGFFIFSFWYSTYTQIWQARIGIRGLAVTMISY
jgi:hypothetical protein